MAKVEFNRKVINDKIQVTVRTHGRTNGVLMFTQDEYEFFVAMVGLYEGTKYVGGHEIISGIVPDCVPEVPEGPVGLGQVP
jgi:hypothetical protein